MPCAERHKVDELAVSDRIRDDILKGVTGHSLRDDNRGSTGLTPFFPKYFTAHESVPLVNHIKEARTWVGREKMG